MFDYQAGEKYKLTLIMVGVAGLLAGMFFTLLLMPAPEPSSARHRNNMVNPRISNDPDITGRRGGYGGAGGEGGEATAGGASAAAPGSAPALVDRAQAQVFMNGWLPRVWDLSAQTATVNQEEAIKWMTPECANAYRHNIWTPELAKQVSESGLQSRFQIRDMNVSDNLSDGSVVIKMHGVQTLGVGGKTGRTREVSIEYMMKQTPDGLRIAGISEGGRK